MASYRNNNNEPKLFGATDSPNNLSKDTKGGTVTIDVASSGLKVAGTMFHEFYHHKLTKDQQQNAPSEIVDANVAGKTQHEKMGNDIAGYQNEKLQFLEEFKGSSLTENETTYHKWSGLQGTESYEKAMYKLDKDGNRMTARDGNTYLLTKEGEKYMKARNAIDSNTGYEKR